MELSVEEKAQRYDEILARATGVYLPYYKEDIMPEVREFAEYLLPELVESEDEKIGKEILDYIDKATGCKRWIGWLEKKVDKDERIRRVLIKETKVPGVEFFRAVTKANEEFIARLRMQGEEKPTDKCEGCNNVKRCVACVDGSEWAHIEMPDLKPYWSEEDERMFKNTIALIETLEDYNKAPDGFGDVKFWLKSLKERVGCEVNCTTTREWSEEDDQYLLVCKNALEKYQTTDKWDAKIISRWLEDKLKSLRPQTTWKPSDEQMKALKKVILCGTPVVGFGELNDLYEDLKILKG